MICEYVATIFLDTINNIDAPACYVCELKHNSKWLEWQRLTQREVDTVKNLKKIVAGNSSNEINIYNFLRVFFIHYPQQDV